MFFRLNNNIAIPKDYLRTSMKTNKKHLKTGVFGKYYVRSFILYKNSVNNFFFS